MAMWWTLALFSMPADKSLEELTQDLALYYRSLKNFHIVYKETTKIPEARPAKAGQRRIWDEWCAPNLKSNTLDESTRVELWDSFPSMRGNFKYIHPNSSSPFSISHKSLKNGEVSSFNPESNYGEIVAAQGLGVFKNLLPQFIGLRVKGSLNTNLAELLTNSGVARLDPSIQKAEGELAVTIGPRIPQTYCSSYFKNSGKILLIFAPKVSALPVKVVRYYIDEETKDNLRKDANGKLLDGDDLFVETETFSDFRAIKDVANNRALTFPYLIETKTAFYEGTFRVESIKLNATLTSDLFRLGNNETRWRVHGKMPPASGTLGTPDSPERLADVAKNVKLAGELLGSADLSAPEENKLIAWLAFGFGALCAAVGAYWWFRKVRDEA